MTSMAQGAGEKIEIKKFDKEHLEKLRGLNDEKEIERLIREAPDCPHLRVSVPCELNKETQFELANCLYEIFKGENIEEKVLEPQYDGMWTWLACLWRKSLVRDKSARITSPYIILESNPRRRYRHRVRGPYEMYLTLCRHFKGEEKATKMAESFFLANKTNVFGDLQEQCASRSWLMSRKVLVELIYGVYSKDKYKELVSRKEQDDKEGISLRALIRELDRLQRVYYVGGMKSASDPGLKQMLPKRFHKLWEEAFEKSKQEEKNER